MSYNRYVTPGMSSRTVKSRKPATEPSLRPSKKSKSSSHVSSKSSSVVRTPRHVLPSLALPRKCWRNRPSPSSRRHLLWHAFLGSLIRYRNAQRFSLLWNRNLHHVGDRHRLCQPWWWRTRWDSLRLRSGLWLTDLRRVGGCDSIIGRIAGRCGTG